MDNRFDPPKPTRWPEQPSGEGSTPSQEAPTQSWPPQPSSIQKKEPLKKRWIVLGCVGLAILAVVGVIAVFALLGGFYLWSSEDLPVGDAERGIVTDIQWVSQWLEGFEIDASHESLRKIRYLDDTYEIDYEYDDADSEYIPYLTCTVNIVNSESEAKGMYAPMWDALRLTMGVTGLGSTRIEERNDVFSWGDTSRFGIFYVDDAPAGNVLVARQDKKVFLFLMTGLYFDDPSYTTEFFLPVLENITHYDPRATGPEPVD